MITSAKIKTLLAQALNDQNAIIKVQDDSHHHAGHREAPEGGGSHFSLIVVAKDFVSLTKIKRHQLVYKALDSALKKGVHAIAIKALSPEEFSNE